MPNSGRCLVPQVQVQVKVQMRRRTSTKRRLSVYGPARMEPMTAPKRDSLWSRSSRARRSVIVAVALVGIALGVTFTIVGNLSLAGASLGLTGIVLSSLALTTPER